ncbi:MAG: 2-C-methyl-D-erythritol 4-phosphate cytidylyltransferase [Ectothiorhodospiraceae bacterium]|nr:2-C-methyl-D-erythritol 4-phosphate cytidylyltransferase [Ectothiorhodospiraceae bacterium]
MNATFFTVCIPAGGTGTRMGAERPKQFLEVAGKPIIAHTLALFSSMPECRRIIVAANDEAGMAALLDEYPLSTPHLVVQGGATRQESVLNALSAVEADDEIVLIHDAVRPCVAKSHVLAVVEAIVRDGAAMLGIPSRDTVKEVHDAIVTATLDRAKIWLAQTPQGARCSALKRAFNHAVSQKLSVTDDASILERAGIPVSMVEGSMMNLKVTTPDDLPVIDFYLRNKEKLF